MSNPRWRHYLGDGHFELVHGADPQDESQPSSSCRCRWCGVVVAATIWRLGLAWLCYSRLRCNFVLVLDMMLLSVVMPQFALVLGCVV
jgi:hypothetical protein